MEDISKKKILQRKEKEGSNVIKKRKYTILTIGLALLAGLLLWYKGEAENVGNLIGSSPFIVVVDPGHGGTFDRPKVLI